MFNAIKSTPAKICLGISALVTLVYSLNFMLWAECYVIGGEGCFTLMSNETVVGMMSYGNGGPETAFNGALMFGVFVSIGIILNEGAKGMWKIMIPGIIGFSVMTAVIWMYWGDLDSSETPKYVVPITTLIYAAGYYFLKAEDEVDDGMSDFKMGVNIQDKPALAALWPSRKGMNIVLDLGANIECSSKNLVDFSIMGSALLKALFPNELPKVALLNIGSEELKGNAMIRETYQKLLENKFSLFDFKGYIEGNNIMEGNVNVIVADGFTGNIALKTAEGTSNFIISELKNALTKNFMGKFSSLINYSNLKNFKNKLDPRLYNGAILLGLDKPVIKSHGSTDSIGFANSLKVCEKTIKGKLIDQIKQNIQ